MTGKPPEMSPVAYAGWSRGETVLERTDGMGGALPCVSLVRSPATGAGGLVADLVDLGRGTEADFRARADEIPGKLVLVRHEYMFATDTIHRRRKYQWALDHGAAGFLIANSSARRRAGHRIIGRDAGKRHSRRGYQRGDGGHALRAMAQGRCASSSKRKKHRERRQTSFSTCRERVPNGSCCRRISTATISRRAPWTMPPDWPRHWPSPPHSHPGQISLTRGLRIALFTIEEWALGGSEIYVDGLGEAERAAIKLNLNLDTIAGSSNLTALTSDFPKLESWLNARAEAHGYALGTHRPVMANSDHFNFARHGIPATRLVAGFNEPNRLKYDTC